jgi:integrase
MRHTEAITLTWGQVDLLDRTIRVGKAKTSAGTGRTITINSDLTSILAAHRTEFVEAFGEPRADHFVFAWGSPMPSDPTRHVTDLKHGWTTLRKMANVSCRLHDLRHTFLTRLAENGTPDFTMLALAGHVSHAMLKHYSHVGLKAKRVATDGLSLRSKEENAEVVPRKVPRLDGPKLVQ